MTSSDAPKAAAAAASADGDAGRLCDEGFAHLEAGRYAEAQALLARAIDLAPANALAHFRLALACSDTGQYERALAELDAAIALEPRNGKAHNNRGTVLQLLDRLREAEQSFRRALEIAPDLVQPYTNLGHLLERQGNLAGAVAVYTQAIHRGLDVALFGHNIAAINGKTTARAPESWVRTTFDNFAPTFDEHLRKLGYDVPARFAALIDQHAAGPLDILDLGCGTGQCGAALAPRRKRLVGIDLSEKMIAVAHARNVYDALFVGEAEAWLAPCAEAQFDLVVAADVFIYIGALDRLFDEVARVLRPGGWFAFSTEEGADADYALRNTGRYAHAHAYIDRIAAAAFDILVAEPTAIRIENDSYIAGRLYLLRRKPGVDGAS